MRLFRFLNVNFGNCKCRGLTGERESAGASSKPSPAAPVTLIWDLVHSHAHLDHGDGAPDDAGLRSCWCIHARARTTAQKSRVLFICSVVYPEML